MVKQRSPFSAGGIPIPPTNQDLLNFIPPEKLTQSVKKQEGFSNKDFLNFSSILNEPNKKKEKESFFNFKNLSPFLSGALGLGAGALFPSIAPLTNTISQLSILSGINNAISGGR